MNSKTAEYIQHFPLPTTYWKGGGLDRMTLYHPLDRWNIRDARQKRIIHWCMWVQRKLGISRSLKMLPSLYGGSTYWSLTRKCVEHVIERIRREPSILARFDMTYVPEEIFFQTLILDSPFAERVVNDNMRFIDWRHRNGNNPAILDLDDLDALKHCGKLFARKFVSPTSDDLSRALFGHLAPA